MQNSYKNILFLCVANSARSQMAEGLAREIFGEGVVVKSAGSQPTKVNPFAIQAMAELGVDIRGQESTHVDDVNPQEIDFVVTLCAEEVCPLFLQGVAQRHWPIPDPDRKNEDLSDEQRLAHFRNTRDQLQMRLRVLQAVKDVPLGPTGQEFHASIRVPDLPIAARFYTWLLGVAPKEWSHRYVVFISEKMRTNLVLLVDDGSPLHQDTLYHLGIDVGHAAAVAEAQTCAENANWHIEKPARTTWRGTPLHELWLKDPGGNLIEIYARLTPEELQEMPDDKEPVFLQIGPLK